MNALHWILTLLVAFGAGHGLFLAAGFAVLRRGRPLANRLLAVILFAISAHLAEILLTILRLDWRVPWISGATWPLIYLIGPAFFLHVRSLLDPEFRLGWRQLPHLLPMLLMLARVWPWLRADPAFKAAQLQAYDLWAMREIAPSTAVALLVHDVQLSVYAALAWRRLRERERRWLAEASDGATAVGLRWLRRFSLGFSLYTGLYCLLLLALLLWGRFGAEIDLGWLLLLSLVVHAIGFLAIQRPGAFAVQLRLEEADPADRDPGLPARNAATGSNGEDGTPGKYLRSAIPPERLAAMAAQLETHLAEQRSWLHEQLRLGELADELGWPVHELSQVINRAGGGSFHDLVNGHRLDEACRRLSDPARQHESVLAIAFDSGFNSKTAFNRAFRARFGTAPSAWRRVALESIAESR